MKPGREGNIQENEYIQRKNMVAPFALRGGYIEGKGAQSLVAAMFWKALNAVLRS